MKNLILLSIISPLLFSHLVAKDAQFTPFVGSTTYDNAIKEKTQNYGIYYTGKKDFKFLIEYSDTKSAKNFNQTNIALSDRFNINDSLDIQMALNYINSSSKEYDGIYSIVLGTKKELSHFNLGLDLAYSVYNNSVLKSVTQISPHLSFNYGNYKSLMGLYTLKLNYDSIRPDSKVNSLSSEYSTFGFTLTQFKAKFQNSLQYWFNDHIFAVRDQGMNVQNHEDIYENALSISSKYNLSPTTSVQLYFIKKDYHQYAQTNTSHLKSFLLFGYFKF